MAQRDTQRARVYKAEAAVHGITFTTMEEVLAYSEKVVESEWWLRNARHLGPVTIVERRHSRGRARYQTGLITLPRFAWFERYLLHELAHLAHGVPHWHEAGHGERYVAVFYSMVREFMGHDAAVRFRRSCLAHGCGGRLPVDTADETSVHATHRLYAQCYRRYLRGERATPPQLRKGMTKAQAAAIRQRLESEQ